MATTMREITIKGEWQLIVANVAMIQFHEDAIMRIGDISEPVVNTGFHMSGGEKHMHNSTDNVWAKTVSKRASRITICEITE